MGGGVSFEFSGYENFVKTYYHERSNPQNNEQTACHEVVPTSRSDQLENIEWKEFKLTDLFDYERGARLTKAHRIAGDIPLLTAGEFNQGVKEFISNEEQKIFSNAITIDMFCNSFVHMREFCCDDNILVLQAKQEMKEMNRYHLQFISTLINKAKAKYGYGKQYRMNSLEQHSILLPVLPTQANSALNSPSDPSLRGSETTEAIHTMDCHSPKGLRNDATPNNDETIHFDFMQSFIKALEKESIKNVVLYQQRLKAAYEEVLMRHCK